MKYEHHNMIEYGLLRVAVIRGSVKDFQGAVIPGACVGIFSETDQKPNGGKPILREESGA